MGNFNSLINYNGNIVIIFTISALIVAGGLGFYVWNEIYNYKNIKKLSLHSKLVLSMTISLIIGGAILFFLFEFSNEATMKGMTFKDRILASILHQLALERQDLTPYHYQI